MLDLLQNLYGHNVCNWRSYYIVSYRKHCSRTSVADYSTNVIRHDQRTTVRVKTDWFVCSVAS